MGSAESSLGDADETNISRIGSSVSKRFQNGVQFNMKLLLRGAHGTGKTSLLYRLQGEDFDINEYSRTPEIQARTVDWSSPRCPEDEVKVEVWDVVDRAIPPASGLAPVLQFEKGDPRNLGTKRGSRKLGLLDARTVDVYHAAHGVLLLLNPFLSSSLDYAQELGKEIPPHLTIVLLLNFMDRVEAEREKVQLTRQDVVALAVQLKDQQRGGEVLVLETSLLDCFGLQELYQILDVPFLRLKEESLRRQADSVHAMSLELERLDPLLNSQSYQAFISDIPAEPTIKSTDAHHNPPSSSTEKHKSSPLHTSTEKHSEPKETISERKEPVNEKMSRKSRKKKNQVASVDGTVSRPSVDAAVSESSAPDSIALKIHQSAVSQIKIEDLPPPEQDEASLERFFESDEEQEAPKKGRKKAVVVVARSTHSGSDSDSADDAPVVGRRKPLKRIGRR